MTNCQCQNPMWFLLVKLLILVHYTTQQSEPIDFGHATTASESPFHLEDRIIHGFPCPIEKTPHLVYLKVKTDSGNFICGGSLISRKWVLTAAHCFKESNANKVTVITGVRSIRRIWRGDEYKVDYGVHHPSYNDHVYSHDIALLKLVKNVRIRKGKVEIAPMVNTTGLVKTCKYGFVAGFGVRDQNDRSKVGNLFCVNVRITPMKKCSISPGDIKKGHISDEVDIFSEVGKREKDACFGDSGGPLMCRGTLVGLVSSGRGCGVTGTCSTYTNIEGHFDFITNITGIPFNLEKRENTNSRASFKPCAKPELYVALITVLMYITQLINF